ncbi:MAG: cell division protein FtsQ/DivIB [Promicromonosporaceae bacterium]|nr:cell division protein FtsQ/DivIB [Promicromonosporaceae bacterium]
MARPKASRKAAPAKTRQNKGRPTVSTAMTRRLAEKRAMQRHRTLRTTLLWVGGVVLVAALGWAAFFSPMLALDASRVSVTGQGTTIDVAQVRAAVAADQGIPLPRLDTVGLRDQILKLNGVKEAWIVRSWPRGIAVHLTSREPVAAVPDGGGVALVDPDGVQVATAAQAPAGMPTIDTTLDDHDAPALQAALHVLAGLPEDLASQVRGVSAASRDDVRTTLHSGQVVRWGSDEQVALKVAVVQTLLHQAPGARTLDVSSPDLPVTR